MSTNVQFSTLDRVPLREAWRHEAGDFTPWLAQADNLDNLAQALGLSELELVATEHAVGDFKLDILCTDGDQKVVIENQLAETDHKHLGQILAYAAGVGARTVVWVAASFRPEHVAALQFINDNTTGDLRFFGVQIELWRIGASPMAPRFEVVAKPNDWVKAGRERADLATSESPIRQLQLTFWAALVEYLATHAPQIRPQKPLPRHWLTTRIGKSKIELNLIANLRAKRIGVEIYLYSESAKQRFAELSLQRDSIEASLGFPLDWQELPDAEACRIAVWCTDASIEDESRWDEYFSWLTHRVVQMDRVFRPLVGALP